MEYIFLDWRVLRSRNITFQEQIFGSVQWSGHTCRKSSWLVWHILLKWPRLAWHLSTKDASWIFINCTHLPYLDMRDIEVGKALCISSRRHTQTSMWGHSYGIKSCCKKIPNLLAMISTILGSRYSSGKEGKETQYGKKWIFMSLRLKFGIHNMVYNPTP